MPNSPRSCGIGPIYSMPRDFSPASTSRNRWAVTTKAQCCMPPMALRLPAGSLPFGISKKARRLSLPMSEEVMTHLLIGWVAAIAGASAKTRRDFHYMDERHTEHFDVEVDRRLHVVSAEREVVDAPRCRGQERALKSFVHVVSSEG